MIDPNAYSLTMFLAVVILFVSFWVDSRKHYALHLTSFIAYWAVLMVAIFAFQKPSYKGLDYMWGENKLIVTLFVLSVAYLTHKLITRRSIRGNN